MSQEKEVLFPTGRLVWCNDRGSFYEPKTKDFDGNPLTYKKGPKVGQARVSFQFGVAILKSPGAPSTILVLSPTLAAQCHTLELLRASGWTDQALIQQNHATSAPGWTLEPWGKIAWDLAVAAFRNN